MFPKGTEHFKAGEVLEAEAEEARRPVSPHLAEPASDERLEQLEADIRKLRIQVAEVRMELAEVKNQLFRDSYLMAQVKEKLAGK